MSNNPQSRMAAFDAMSEQDRELANEFGVNVVRLYRNLGADNFKIRECCERHRLNRQLETLVPVTFKKEARAATRKQVQADLARLLSIRSVEAEQRLQVRADRLADEVIKATEDHAPQPAPIEPPKRSWFSRMLGR